VPGVTTLASTAERSDEGGDVDAVTVAQHSTGSIDAALPRSIAFCDGRGIALIWNARRA
jgi:hypothetical protein